MYYVYCVRQVIRHYHGHLSAVYSIDIHPTIDVLVTCGRDATARVWYLHMRYTVFGSAMLCPTRGQIYDGCWHRSIICPMLVVCPLVISRKLSKIDP